MLTKEFFINNRNVLRKKVGVDCCIIITANSLLQRSGDTTFPFRQDSNFYYLTGLNEPDLVVVILETEEFIVLPKRSEVETIFGGILDCDKIAKVSGIKTVYSYKDGWDKINKMRQNRNTVQTFKAPSSKISGIDSYFTSPSRRSLIQKLRRANPSTVIQDIRPELGALRQIKQPQEIEMIQRAITITKEGFLKAKSVVAVGTYEYEIEASFDHTFKLNQAGHGYQPIIAGGERACILHYTKNNQRLENNKLYLIDAGAEHSNYSADVTRTYGLSATERQATVINEVRQIQVAAIALLRPELSWRDFIKQVQEITGESLVRLGLISEVTSAAVRKYFPHGISHSLGLDVHDVCDYKTIQENMVITVEPGIYIPEEGIGVRIEDDILITKTGAVNLSADIPY